MRFIPKIFKPDCQYKTVAGFELLVLLLAVACSSATATREPPPVPTVIPTSTPLPPAESAPVTVDLDGLAMDAHAELQMLLDELGPRESATDQESAAARYLEETFLGFGYATEIQTFPVIGKELAGMGLTPTTPEYREFVALSMSGSGLGDVSGILTPGHLGMPGDIPDGSLQGRVALAKREVIPFQSKAENVFAAGAIGLVVYNNAPGIFQGAPVGESEFPAITISGADGEAIKELLAEAETQAAIALTMRERTSRNVIAETSGAGEAVVVPGGHYDSVAGIAGANDNASGTAVFLAIARKLESVDPPFTLRIVPFGSEELRLLVSQYYVHSLTDRELEKIKVMLNFDTLGSGSGYSVFGSSELTDLIKATQSEAGEEVTVTRGISSGTSGFASFQNSGVPFLMFYGDDLTRNHSDRGTIEFVQPELLESVVSAAVTLIQSPKFAEFVDLE